MSVRLVFEGLDAFKAALRQLPEDLTAEGADLVERHTEITETRLVQSYPLGDSGNLRRGVSSTVDRSRGGVIGRVVSKSPHAHLWEFGTQVRKTAQGWNRGSGPAHFNQGLVGIASQERRRLNTELIDVLERAGFTVSGAL